MAGRVNSPAVAVTGSRGRQVPGLFRMSRDTGVVENCNCNCKNVRNVVPYVK